MFEHSFYSVISPEGCAAILWRTGEQRKLAAESLKLTAKDLMRLNIIDSVIKEPLGGAHRDPAGTIASLEKYFTDSLRELKRYKVDTLLRKRYERIRGLGSFFEKAADNAKAPVTDEKTQSRAKADGKITVKSPARPMHGMKRPSQTTV